MPSLEVVEVVLVQCNIVDNHYQQKSEVSYAFTSNKSLLIWQMLNQVIKCFYKLITLSLMKLS